MNNYNNSDLRKDLYKLYNDIEECMSISGSALPIHAANGNVTAIKSYFELSENASKMQEFIATYINAIDSKYIISPRLVLLEAYCQIMIMCKEGLKLQC